MRWSWRKDLLGRLQTMRRAFAGRSIAGSLRRMAETIGDVDLLVAAADHEPVMEAFAGFDVVDRVIARGETKTSILTRIGLQVDLRVIPREAWGAAMIYFTGSKAHNIRIREMAVRKGLKLNEYGLFQADSGDLLAAETEAGGLRARSACRSSSPRLREDRGEIEAALGGRAPRPDHPAADPRRPAHAHRPHRRARHARTHARGRRRASVRLLRRHRPRARSRSCSG